MHEHLAAVAFCLTTVAAAPIASAQLRFAPRVTFLRPAQLRFAPRASSLRPTQLRPAPVARPSATPVARPVPVAAATRAEEPAPAPEPARLDCRAEENGAWAPASFVALRDGREIASGRCGSAIDIEPGAYDVVLTLESALDRPTRRVRVDARPGGHVRATGRFETSILEVRFTKDGRSAAGLAVILRNGQRVGTLGSGVAAHLSSGRYQIIARYRTEERVYTVDLAPGQRRAIRAAF